MADDARVLCCQECGWPALLTTRRCPYCRAAMPRLRRARGRFRVRPLLTLAALWLISVISVVSITFWSLGGLAALAVAAIAAGPTIFLYLLHRRSAMRIRAMRARHRAADPSNPRDRNRSTTNS